MNTAKNKLADRNAHTGRWKWILLIGAFIIASPLDDILITSAFGSIFFAIGSIEFYILLLATTSISTLIWAWHRRRTKLQAQYPTLNRGFNGLQRQNKQ